MTNNAFEPVGKSLNGRSSGRESALISDGAGPKLEDIRLMSDAKGGSQCLLLHPIRKNGFLQLFFAMTLFTALTNSVTAAATPMSSVPANTSEPLYLVNRSGNCTRGFPEKNGRAGEIGFEQGNR